MESEDVVNVLEKFENTTIASILEQHFWFQVGRNDELSEFLCQICWNNTKTFHIFYEEVELLQEDYWNLAKTAGTAGTNLRTDFIKQEPSDTELQIEETRLESSAMILDVKGNETIFATYDQIEMSPALAEDLDEKQRTEKITHSISEENSATTVEKPKKGRKPYPYEHRLNNDYLDAHLKVYFSMKCDICGDPFKTYRNAREHFRETHRMKCYLICCRKRFRRRGAVLDHIKYHLNPDAFTCKQCGRKFASRAARTLHIANHEPMSTRPFKCDLCPKSFPREIALTVHKDFVHLPVKCVECDMTYPSKSKLSTHVKNAHKPKVTTTRVCDICGKDYANKYSLLIHMQEQHSAVKNPGVQCDICGTWLKQKSRLRNHMKQHQETVPAQCKLCGKVKKSEFLLTKHMQFVHTEKKHLCTICSKSFRTALSLKIGPPIRNEIAMRRDVLSRSVPRFFEDNALSHAPERKYVSRPPAINGKSHFDCCSG
ncbi:Transcription factor grauzone [Pseudolycoriella hygida]|uniref:Transcription factor grauzone n=1 Tax=Pseudolycoriella hygida TaxID=35572 RepID=A0A9Q0MHZ5_9DIPT|nr:Transcription factor grauzone [Pseudolycoriella hygida]